MVTCMATIMKNVDPVLYKLSNVVTGMPRCLSISTTHSHPKTKFMDNEEGDQVHIQANYQEN